MTGRVPAISLAISGLAAIRCATLPMCARHAQPEKSLHAPSVLWDDTQTPLAGDETTIALASRLEAHYLHLRARVRS
jgi:hypothetical protein